MRIRTHAKACALHRPLETDEYKHVIRIAYTSVPRFCLFPLTRTAASRRPRRAMAGAGRAAHGRRLRNFLGSGADCYGAGFASEGPRNLEPHHVWDPCREWPGAAAVAVDATAEAAARAGTAAAAAAPPTARVAGATCAVAGRTRTGSSTRSSLSFRIVFCWGKMKQ